MCAAGCRICAIAYGDGGASVALHLLRARPSFVTALKGVLLLDPQNSLSTEAHRRLSLRQQLRRESIGGADEECASPEYATAIQINKTTSAPGTPESVGRGHTAAPPAYRPRSHSSFHAAPLLSDFVARSVLRLVDAEQQQLTAAIASEGVPPWGVVEPLGEVAEDATVLAELHLCTKGVSEGAEPVRLCFVSRTIITVLTSPFRHQNRMTETCAI